MIRWLIVCLVMLVWAVRVFGQNALIESYIHADDLVIDYPASWHIEADPVTGFIYLSGEDIQATIYSPPVLRAYQLADYDPIVLLRLIAALNAAVTAHEPEMLLIDTREIAVLPYENHETGLSGLLVAHRFDEDAIGLIDSYANVDSLETSRDQLLQIAASLRQPPFPAPVSLTHYNASWQQVIAELENSGLIVPDEQLAFAENYVFAAGMNLTVPLAQALSIDDSVTAGTLFFTPSANPVRESCGIVARYNGTDRGLEVGIRADGDLYAADSSSEIILQSGVDISQPMRVVFAVLGDRLLVYAAGDLVGDIIIVHGSGYFGVRVQADAPGAVCEVRDLWVYPVSANER